MERIPDILQRLAVLETAVERSERLLKSSVDDIKATVRSEISDLKSEQINDIRKLVDTDHMRLNEIERRQDRWEGGAGITGWLIKVIIGLAGIGAGYFGSGHIK